MGAAVDNCDLLEIWGVTKITPESKTDIMIRTVNNSIKVKPVTFL